MREQEEEQDAGEFQARGDDDGSDYDSHQDQVATQQRAPGGDDMARMIEQVMARMEARLEERFTTLIESSARSNTLHRSASAPSCCECLVGSLW